MTVKPLYDRLLARRVEEGEQVKGGIIIPDSAKEKPQEAEIIAVGNGKRLDDGKIVPLDVKAGDKVLIGKYSGMNAQRAANSVTLVPSMTAFDSSTAP